MNKINPINAGPEVIRYIVRNSHIQAAAQKARINSVKKFESDHSLMRNELNREIEDKIERDRLKYVSGDII